MKNSLSVARKLVAILVLGIMVSGCSTTRYGVEISNVHNIREIYIKNAGTHNWGSNMTNNIENIDRSRFSERVDIRVIDTNGVAYSNYNVSFNDTAFGEPSVSRYMGIGTNLLIAAIGIGILIPLVILNDFEGQ